MNVRRLLPAILGVAVVVCLTSVASASAAPSLSRYLASDTESADLRNGYGTAAFHARGAILGSIRRGSVTIVDLPRGKKTVISVDGEETVRHVTDRVTVYRGRRISFYVEKGWWKVQIKGRDIHASAVVHGRLALQGRAGTYSLDFGPVHDWPGQRRVFRLG